MAINAKAAYALSLDQAAAAIAAWGNKRTALLEGPMGSGKTTVASSLPKMFDQFKDYSTRVVDCATLDIGDISCPWPDTEAGYVRMMPNEAFAPFIDKPGIIVFDELGKASQSVLKALMPLINDRRIGVNPFHEDTIVVATTNLAGEGLGDFLQAHQANRVVRLETRHFTNMEWIEWGINNNIHPSVLGWARENPQLFQDFRDVSDPENNPYIPHPRANRTAFVTPRSLHTTSDILHATLGVLDMQTITASLMGAIGDRGAMDLMAFVELASDLPTLESIKKDPTHAKVPQAAAAVCMTVYKALATIDATWIDAWMTYMDRLEAEAQGLFANGVRAEKFDRKSEIMNTKSFGSWCVRQQHMFAADKG